jgi:predicted secreted protein
MVVKGTSCIINPKLMLLAVILLSLMCSLSHVHGEEIMVVDKAFNGREVKVRAGTMIKVELEQAGAAGYTWEIQDPNTKHFEVMSVKTPEPPEKPDLVGAPIKKTWLIKVKEKGKSELRFFHFRPWEGKEKAADSFALKVRII